jgi:hypothetical protein
LRTCPGCKLPRLVEEFGKNRQRSNGLNSYCRSCANSRGRMIAQRSRLAVLRHYSHGDPVCACCEETRLEFLSIDHINGGGGKHIREIGSNLARWLTKQGFPDGYRVLCHNCNFALGHYGYCPHQAGTLLDPNLPLTVTRRTTRGERSANARLTNEAVAQIKQRLAAGQSQYSLAREFGVSQRTILRIKQGISWVDIPASP